MARKVQKGGGREGDGVERLLMGCGVDVDGRNFLWSIKLLAHPVVSFQIIYSERSAFGRWIDIEV